MIHTVADFDFDLPPELIAQHPAAERSASRLLDGRTLPAVERVFRDVRLAAIGGGTSEIQKLIISRML